MAYKKSFATIMIYLVVATNSEPGSSFIFCSFSIFVSFLARNCVSSAFATMKQKYAIAFSLFLDMKFLMHFAERFFSPKTKLEIIGYC